MLREDGDILEDALAHAEPVVSKGAPPQNSKSRSAGAIASLHGGGSTGDDRPAIELGRFYSRPNV